MYAFACGRFRVRSLGTKSGTPGAGTRQGGLARTLQHASAMMRDYSLNYQSTGGRPPLGKTRAQQGVAARTGLPEVEALVIVKYSHDARSVREALDLAGIEHGVTVTTDGLEALSFVRQRGGFSHIPRPDFIVLDLELDNVSGRVVLDSIRTNPEMRWLPVILLGGSPAEWRLSRWDDLKDCHFVSKPACRDALAVEFGRIKTLICKSCKD